MESHMHQPPGSSKWDVYKQAIIVSTEGKLKWTLQDLLLSEVIRTKLNFALSSRELS